MKINVNERVLEIETYGRVYINLRLERKTIKKQHYTE
jgi:hypothetical protein